VNYGMYNRMVLDFPTANDYFDAGSINLLRTSYDAFREADLLTDLFAHFQKQLGAAPGSEKVYHHLALGYMHWWNNEKDESLQQLTLAAQQVPNDLNLVLEAA